VEEIPITQNENNAANEEGAYIFGYLRKKYANNNVSHLDICLNSICFALLRLMKNFVEPKDHELFIDKIIVKILKNGMKK